MSNLILVNETNYCEGRWLEFAFTKDKNIFKYKHILNTSYLDEESKKKYLSLHDDIFEGTIDLHWRVTGYFYSGNYPPLKLDDVHTSKVPSLIRSFLSLDK